MKKEKESLENFLDVLPEDNISPEVEEKSVSLEEIAEVIAPVEGGTPKKRKRRTKKELTPEKDETNEIEKRSMSLSLIGLTKSVSLLLNEPIWSIEDREEADFLAESTINFLDKVFPNWRKSSPYLDFISAWSAYFVKRLFVKKTVKETDGR